MYPQNTTINLTSMSNSTDTTMPNGMMKPMGLRFSTVNIVICFLALLLNLAEAFLIIHQRKVKPFKKILLNLCSADVMITLLYVIQKFYEKENNKPIYGFKMEDLSRKSLVSFSVMSSITNIIVLGINRLIAVRYPFKHGIWMTPKVVNLAIAGAWIGSIILSVLSNINRFAETYNKSDSAKVIANRIFAGLLFSSGFIIIGIYTLIIVTVARHRKIATKMRRSGGAEKSDEMTVTVTCVLVVAAFIICSYPFAIDLLISKGTPALPFKVILLNAALDSLVYFFMGYLKRKLRTRKSNKKLEIQSVER